MSPAKGRSSRSKSGNDVLNAPQSSSKIDTTLPLAADEVEDAVQEQVIPLTRHDRTKRQPAKYKDNSVSPSHQRKRKGLPNRSVAVTPQEPPSGVAEVEGLIPQEMGGESPSPLPSPLASPPDLAAMSPSKSVDLVEKHWNVLSDLLQLSDLDLNVAQDGNPTQDGPSTSAAQHR